MIHEVDAPFDVNAGRGGREPLQSGEIPFLQANTHADRIVLSA
jgi:hypothetical protein